MILYDAHTAIALLSLTSTLLLPLAVLADENRLLWRTQTTSEYDSNSRLRADNKTSLTGTRLQTSADYSNSAASHNLSTGLSAYREQYNRSEYDFSGYTLDTQLQKRGEASVLILDIDASRQSTRISELTDTGTITDTASARQQYAGSLFWQQQHSEKGRLYSNASFTQVDYDSDTFADYHNWGLSLGWQYQASPRSQWQIQTSYSEYQSEQYSESGSSDTLLLQQSSEVTAKTESLQASFNHQLSERFTSTISLGQSWTDNRVDSTSTQSIPFLGQITSSSQSNTEGDLWTANIAANYAMPRGDISLQLTRNTKGSGNGSLTEINQGTLQYQHAISATRRFSAKLYYSEQEDFLSTDSRQSREYYSVELGLRQQLSKVLTTRLNTGYRAQQFSSRSERPESYSVQLSLQYTPYSTLW